MIYSIFNHGNLVASFTREDEALTAFQGLAPAPCPGIDRIVLVALRGTAYRDPVTDVDDRPS